MADSPDVRKPSRGRTAAIVAAAVVVALGLAFVLATVKYQHDKKRVSPAQFLAADKVGDPVRSIGPVKGTDLNRYAKSRAKALSDAHEPRVAVISLDRYTTDREARASVASSEVLSFLAATPGGLPSDAGRDLKAWADKQRADAKAERDGLNSQIPTVDDADMRHQFEADVQRLNALIDRVSATGPVVFAVVVRAPADRLKELGKSAGVRLVDVGSSDKLGDKPAFTGIRPEEVVKAGEPDTRPL